MPIEYKICQNHDVLCVKYWGVLNLKDMLQLLDAIESDASYHHTMDELDDFTQVTKIAMGLSEISSMSQLIQGLYLRHGARKRNAIVSPPWFLEKALRVYLRYSTSRSDVETEIFREVPEALESLDISQCSEIRTLLSASPSSHPLL